MNKSKNAIYYYVTCNELPSGLYHSQVIQVVKFLRMRYQINLRLLALIPLRGFLKNRRKIKALYPMSLVLPSAPTWQLFRLNYIWMLFIGLFVKPSGMITRSGFANALARFTKHLHSRIKIIYDGRGLMQIEALNYNIYPKDFVRQISKIEKAALVESDLVMCITSGMINIWENQYEIAIPKFISIPCTVSENFHNHNISVPSLLDPEFVWVAYSGSTAEWQSIELVTRMLSSALSRQSNLACLFLTTSCIEIDELIKNYGHRRVRRDLLDHLEVPAMLSSCDYGIMIREKNIQNSIASPTKFAEYLCAGLSIITNNSMAIQNLVVEHNLGIIVSEQLPFLTRIEVSEKLRIRNIGLANFSKNSEMLTIRYNEVIQHLIS